MATAGNLVFQGNAEGKFVAYAADSGDELWSVTTGSAINAAPASYSLGGKQYVVIPVGAGGGVQFYYPKMHATENAKGPTRLMAFTIGGSTDMPDPGDTHPPLPEQPALEATPQTIGMGKALYAGYCKGCHGVDGAARFGGSVPDLRYADEATHATWHGIVIGGARSANGMPSFELEIEQSEAIRNFILSLSEEIRAQQ